jgi:hypothetical protein
MPTGAGTGSRRCRRNSGLPRRCASAKSPATVQDALAWLREKDREILQLGYWDALGTAEIAGILRCSRADGGPVQGGSESPTTFAGQDGIACVLDFSVTGPGPLKCYSFSNRRLLGGPAWGLSNFQTLGEAAAFTQTKEYQHPKAVLTSLTVSKIN